MKLQQAKQQDLDLVMDFLNDGKSQLAKLGVNQWQDNYPSAIDVTKDITTGSAFLIQSDTNQNVGVISIVSAPDHAYDSFTGKWLQDTEQYVSIHRIAIHSDHSGKGYATKILEQVIGFLSNAHPPFESIRADTNENNLPMQHVFEKLGFVKVGEMTSPHETNNDIYFVYEKSLKNK
ncbi:GNAT family N-acetyltransferase [Lactobacillus sp. ESL0680]|uniref:GNAT family N-acetyltransferase n=1 Tax=Lactobacillus sp. ESL0680 TaxID=2983210 RepID=UPI0023F6BB04|nr:GNAT family N-acetyltransferase [Lactobacillus sp. ESL0680]WEV38710.1 GNAT family N-acetyltransferase [Lactobacillus sp. ESL0680]